MDTMPQLKNFADGSNYWEHSFDTFSAKVYLPTCELPTDIINYGFMTPYLLVFEEKKLTPQKISNVMGMYDVMPTLGNMFGFSNEYALGHDIFTIKENNIVVFPTGNWLTNKMYYNSQQDESYIINNAIISQEYITQNSEYADKLLSISNDILVFDLIRNSKEETVNETDIIKGN